MENTIPKISLLMPTRGRSTLAERFIQSVRDTSASIERIEIIIYADDDDVDSHGIGSNEAMVTRIIGPRMTMGEYNSACLERARGDIIILVNDDMVIRTKGWDDIVCKFDESVDDKIYLAYGNDLFKGGKLCTFPILSRKTCQVLQQPYHHAYRGAFIDYHLMDIFKRLERAGYHRIFYLEEVVFEHLHYRTGKAVKDETYTARGRFVDDMLFVGLADVRAASLPLLVEAIHGEFQQEVKSLPAYRPIEKPASLWRAFLLFTRTFLGDPKLPLKWRFFLWWWFGARYVASRIL